MVEPDIVPDKLKESINYWVIGLIIAAAIGVQLVFTSLSEDDLGTALFTASLVSAGSVSAAGFVIAKRYWGTQVFGRSYLFLSIGFFSYFVAEVLYYTFDLYLGIDPYPSIADIFFFAFYPFTLLHLIINIKFFSPGISLKQKSWLILFPLFVFIVYAYTSFVEFEEPSFDFFYGIIFVLGASVVMAFTSVGASIFRQGVIGVAWFLLVIAILISTVGDVWYYYLEVFGLYSDVHPVNVMWYVHDFLIIYALIKHKKII